MILRRFLPFLLLAMCSPGMAGETVTKPLRITKGGTPEQPAIFDGKGMVIDLGKDVTDHSWQKEGEVWTSTGPIAGPKPVSDGQFTALFVDDMPITIARDGAAEKAAGGTKSGFKYHPAAKLKPGQMGCEADGSIYFRWPAGKAPGQGRIVLPSNGGVSGVSIACSHIIIRNITATHAGNDGFNIHGDFKGIRLENIRAIANGDEGISAHENVQMDVDGAEIAWNGSSVGGVADVGRSTTNYKNCKVHDNIAGAFKFFGVSHSVTDTVIYNQPQAFSIGPDTKFKEERVERK